MTMVNHWLVNSYIMVATWLVSLVCYCLMMMDNAWIMMVVLGWLISHRQQPSCIYDRPATAIPLGSYHIMIHMFVSGFVSVLGRPPRISWSPHRKSLVVKQLNWVQQWQDYLLYFAEDAAGGNRSSVGSIVPVGAHTGNSWLVGYAARSSYRGTPK